MTPRSARPPAILVAEDVASLRQSWAAYFQRHGFAVSQAATTQAVRAALEEQRFDAVILDLMLEDGDVLPLLRERLFGGSRVIVVTASDDVVDRVLCLELGADDLVSKPVHLRELLARVRKPSPGQAAPPAAAPPFTLDPVAREVVRSDGARFGLSPSEFKVLRFLAERPGSPVSRDDLIAFAGVGGFSDGSRSLEVVISRVRKKIDCPGRASMIRKVRHGGFVLEARDEASAASAPAGDAVRVGGTAGDDAEGGGPKSPGGRCEAA